MRFVYEYFFHVITLLLLFSFDQVCCLHSFYCPKLSNYKEIDQMQYDDNKNINK